MKSFKLKNGLTVIMVEKAASETAAVLLINRAGSRNENLETYGAAHFFEHMVFKGTKKRQGTEKIAEFLDEIGGEYNAFTSKEYTGFHAHVSNKHALRGLDFITDLIQNPLLKEIDFNLEKGVINEEISLYEDMPIHLVDDLIFKAIFGNDPLAHLISGTHASVKKMKLESLKNFYQTHYTAPNMALVLVADKKTLASLKNGLADYTDFRSEKANISSVSEVKKTGPRVECLKKDISQGNIIIGFEAPSYSSLDRIKMNVLSSLFGGMMSSRLFIRIRHEKGLCYYIRSSYDSFRSTGIQISQAGIDPENVILVLNAILNEYSIIKTQPITTEELSKTKEYLKGKIALSLEDSEAIADFYGHQWALSDKLTSPHDIMKQIDSVTVNDILKVAQKYFARDTLSVAVVSPEIDEKAIKVELDKFK